jgi:hypothetical protein
MFEILIYIILVFIKKRGEKMERLLFISIVMMFSTAIFLFFNMMIRYLHSKGKYSFLKYAVLFFLVILPSQNFILKLSEILNIHHYSVTFIDLIILITLVGLGMMFFVIRNPLKWEDYPW